MSRLLLHSVSYSGLWGQAFLPVDEFVDKAAELGFDGVMLMAKRPHVSPIDYDDQDRARLRSLIESRGLSAPVLAGYSNLTGDLEHAEIPHREIWVGYLGELARLARDLGGSVVRVFTGYESPAAGYYKQVHYIAEVLREAAARAAEFGVTLAIQNHHDTGVGYETLLDLLLTIDRGNCKAAFDAWAPALQGVNIVRAARVMAPHTVHTTVADYQLRPRYRYQPELVNYEPATPYAQAVPMGEGFIDYRAFLAALAQGGFAGSIAYEMCSPLRDGGQLQSLDAHARRFIEYMKEG